MPNGQDVFGARVAAERPLDARLEFDSRGSPDTVQRWVVTDSATLFSFTVLRTGDESRAIVAPAAAREAWIVHTPDHEVQSFRDVDYLLPNPSRVVDGTTRAFLWLLAQPGMKSSHFMYSRNDGAPKGATHGVNVETLRNALIDHDDQVSRDVLDRYCL